MIDRYQLRYFLAVVDQGNFSRAAVRMNVAQPTLSVGIAKLEQEVGAKLFFRNSQRVSLTEAGARFLDHARAIEREFAAAGGVVRQATTRRIRLGVLTTVPNRLVEQAVLLHRQAREPDEIELVEGSERDLAGLLHRGRIDVALSLLHGLGQSAFEEPLWTEGYALALSRDHPLGGAEVLRAEDIASEVMIVRRHCEALSAYSRWFTERGVRPAFSLRSVNDDRVMAMVRAGLGLTVMPESYRGDGVARPRLEGFDAQRTVGLLYGAQWNRAQPSSLITALRTASGAETARSWTDMQVGKTRRVKRPAKT